MPASAIDIARYFLAIQDEEETITNLKLQKLLYYAQGFHLALTGKPLFAEQIKAWVHGPVVPAVWHEFKDCGSAPIPRPADFDPDSLNTETRSIIDEVYAVYGQFSAWRLREMTHEEAPWKEAQQSGVIPRAAMESFFKTLIH
jgi:uncharacterized phage-associated protein